MVSEETIKKIISSVDIVEVIGSYIDLIPKGKNYFAVCPFHDDHTPSMSVSREKQIFRCFTCGASGNVITFVMKYENVGFVEALSILGKRIGIEINKNEKKKTIYDKYYQIYDTATNLYKVNLFSSKGIKAKRYLYDRKINDELIKKFNIGLSTYDDISNILLKKYNKEDLIKIGLSYENKGVTEDLFKNRIMFPIQDIYGNTVGYSGRIYEDDSTSKYINTKETIIFKKGKILYNYYNAKDEIRKKREIIICEGFMDVIRLSSVGINNAVALMGTSFTTEQLNFIKKLNVEVVLNLDNDNPGRLATFQIGNTLFKSKVNTYVIQFEKYKDTDELISNDGGEAFIKSYNNKVSYIDYKLFYLKNQIDLKDAENKSKYINQAIEIINELDDNVLKEIKINELSNEFNVSKDILKQKVIFNDNIKEDKIVNYVKPKKKYNKYTKSEMKIIYLMLNHDEVIINYTKNLGFLPSENMRQLANEIVYFREKNKYWNYAEFFNYVYDKPELNEALEEILANETKEDYTTRELEDYFTVVKKYEVDKQIKKLTEKIKSTLDIEEKKRLAKRIEKMKKEVLQW